MEAKEKALELYNEFYKVIPSDEMGLSDESARQCAIIEINGRIEEIKLVMKYFNCFELGNRFKFLIEIKQELINL